MAQACYPKILSQISITMTESLRFDKTYWDNVLGKDARKSSNDVWLHMLASLLVYLNLPLHHIIDFIPSSGIDSIKLHAGQFMGYLICPAAGTLLLSSWALPNLEGTVAEVSASPRRAYHPAIHQRDHPLEEQRANPRLWAASLLEFKQTFIEYQ